MRRISLFLLLPLVLAAAEPIPRFDEHLGASLPMAAQVRDESGRTRTLSALMNGKPTILWFRYLRCPQLCSVVGDGTISSLRQLEESAGPDFTVLSISIDPTDTTDMAAEAQQREERLYGRHQSRGSWHVATASAATIEALASAAGFEYRFDPRSRLYSHPSGLLVVTPEGRISAYVTGVDFPAKAISAALIEAREGKIGPSAYQWVISCLEGGASQGRYARLIWIVLWTGVLATVITVFGGIGWMLFSERRSRTEPSR